MVDSAAVTEVLSPSPTAWEVEPFAHRGSAGGTLAPTDNRPDQTARPDLHGAPVTPEEHLAEADGLLRQADLVSEVAGACGRETAYATRALAHIALAEAFQRREVIRQRDEQVSLISEMAQSMVGSVVMLGEPPQLDN